MKDLLTPYFKQELNNDSYINRAIKDTLISINNRFNINEFIQNVNILLINKKVNITQYHLEKIIKESLNELEKSGYLIKKDDYYQKIPEIL